MKIISKTPLTLGQAKEYTKNLDETKPIHGYLKTFTKLSKDKSEALFGELKALNNPKIKDDEIVKAVDILPEDAEDVNKIFIEANLTEEEVKQILDIVSKYLK